jgi:two-component system chemotaxis response regulator CheB
VYLAPPDRHLLIKRKGSLTLTDSELVNFVRPSADLLFESVAAAYGDRAIAVVLTGTGRDGALGVTAIKQRGGTVVVQDEDSSEFFGMPSAAIKTGVVDFVLPLDEIAPALVSLLAAEAVT